MRKFVRLQIFLLTVIFVSCSSDPSDTLGLTEDPSSYDTSYTSPHVVSSVENQSSGLTSGWWQNSTFYHVWMKSFAHSSDDGISASKVVDGSIGNFDGITAKLGYIQETLGCDTIWLSPFMACNSGSSSGSRVSTNMHGYDITDFYTVNSNFGTEEDLIQLIDAVHARGMKIIFDFVPNHTSSQCAWFNYSINKKTVDGVDYTNWYLWNDTKLSWNPMGNSNTWYYNETRKQYYYAPFWSEMPDLNYRCPEVRVEMKNVVKYWLSKGFDGLRADAVLYLIENDGQYSNTPQTHALLAEFRSTIDSFTSPKMMLAETWVTNNRSTLNAYFGTATAPEFNMLLDFDAGNSIFNAIDNSRASYATSCLYTGDHTMNCTYGTFLANHDEYKNRLGTVYTDESRRKLATAMSLLRPTTAIIYYGQEIAQADASVSGDIRHRYPFDWDAEATQASASDSVLKLNKACVAARSQYPALTQGSVNVLDTSTTNVAAYTLSKSGEKAVLCVFNLSSTAQGVTLSGSSIPSSTTYTRLVSDGSETLTWSGSSITVSSIGAYGYCFFVLGSDSETLADAKMYLYGSMNSWSSSTPMSYDSANKKWTVTVSLTANTSYEFKFRNSSSSTWATSDNYPAENLTYIPTTTGDYVFTLNAVSIAQASEISGTVYTVTAK